MLYAVISTQHYPNVVAVAKALASGNPTHNNSLWRMTCVEPAYNYFHLKFDNDLKPALGNFKIARYFSPLKFHETYCWRH